MERSVDAAEPSRLRRRSQARTSSARMIVRAGGSVTLTPSSMFSSSRTLPGNG